ncbi:uncharacterized protein LOC103842769 [Brassica rapa]|uniref:uncharacterized protein LOC103842769 n=1 Tax=Brassica campestris TaxID=3711 RepID=UPI00142DCBE0|nr:uncharacterized protein LOC103842769 [Brassica rapa]
MAILRFGFHPIWTEWIMQCITTVSYSFIINDASRGHVTPGRGIRQGDPLSPYLFILCSQLLSSLCTMGQSKGTLKGIKISSGAPPINHLLFADDTMFFCKANEQNAQTLNKILATYASVSGQLINLQKSAVSFSKGTILARKDQIKLILGIDNDGGFGIYLGLPEKFGRRKRDGFANIVNRIKIKSISWSSKFLSRAGKMIMLRTVLSAMPSHAMSCFKLPLTLCAQIQSLLTRFWWDDSHDKRKMSWISWKRMARSKKQGGLGFKEIATFNDALLAKLSWRILKNPSCLLARCLLGKYCKDENFLSIKASTSSSYGWKGILIGRDLLINQLGWIVGSGNDIRVWDDAWLSTTDQQRPYGPAPEALKELRVSDLMLPNSTSWDTQKIESILPFHKQSILQLKPSICNAPDEMVWLKTASGDYTVKSGYMAKEEQSCLAETPTSEPTVDWLANVWNLKTPEKIKVFLWNSLHAALPVGEQFAIRNIPLSTRCPRCNEMESVAHMLFNCDYAKEVWSIAPLASIFDPSSLITTNSGLDLLRRIPSLPPIGLGPGTLSASICWNLWISRNQLIFQKRVFTPKETLLKAICEAREWTFAQDQSSKTPSIQNRIAQDPDPDPSLTRMYTDAAWNPVTKCAGLAWIIDDAVSSSSHSATETSVVSPLMAETLALRKAMTSALHRGTTDLLILSDSQTLIKLVNSKCRHLEIATLLIDIQLLSPLFNSVKFKFIPRLDNCMTDSVAKQALSMYQT